MSTPIQDLPTIDERWDEIAAEVTRRTPAVFLDFDGTLSPIVEDPGAAALPDETRAAIERLREQCWVAVMSGRDADDVRSRVGIEGLVYAGSHGFDVIWPDGRREVRGTEYQESLRRAQAQLEEALAEVPGAELEPKRFAVAIHYRRVADEHVPDVEAAVARVAEGFDDLRRTGGKRVHELRPDLDWDKGRALTWLLETLDLDHGDVLPIYFGDDLTDEDAFAAIGEHGHGLALVVRGEDDTRTTLGDVAIGDVQEAGRVLGRLADVLEERA